MKVIITKSAKEEIEVSLPIYKYKIIDIGEEGGIEETETFTEITKEGMTIIEIYQFIYSIPLREKKICWYFTEFKGDLLWCVGACLSELIEYEDSDAVAFNNAKAIFSKAVEEKEKVK